MTGRDDRSLRVTAGLLLPLAVGGALALARDTVSSAVVAVVLACTVIVGARLGGRPGGVGAALMAAATFDFFHTAPYQSLKIANADDLSITVGLLVAGLLVGGLAHDRSLQQRRYRATAAVNRVLEVAQEASAEDVEAATRSELMELLQLRACWFTAQPSPLPELPRAGSYLPGSTVGVDGFTLPPEGVVIPVEAGGRHFGWLVCLPGGGAGVSPAAARNAHSLGELLGLALWARTPA